jgi:hypothetical protein
LLWWPQVRGYGDGVDDRGSEDEPPVTPDARYIVVRGRLWRRANLNLLEHVRQTLVETLMDARRAVRRARKAGDQTALFLARASVNDAKVALGERVRFGGATRT